MGIIRIFLAAVVVYGHMQLVITQHYGLNVGPWFLLGMNAGYAVMYFYIISGFLISYSLAGKYEGKTTVFYKNRFIRIFSLYWPVYLFVVFLMPHGGMAGRGLLMHVLSIIIVGSDWVITLAKPQGTVYPFPPYLGVAWSLDAELTFYIIAPFVLRSFRACVTLFVFSLLARLSLQYVNGFGPWVYFFFPTTVMLFLLGHFMNVFREYLKLPLWGALVLLALSSVCAVESAGAWGACFYMAFALFAFSLPSIFEATKSCLWMNVLGEASFPVYLIHLSILYSIPAGVSAAAINWLAQSPFKGFSAEIFALGVIFVVVITALIVHYVIERPVATAMHRAVDFSGRLMEPFIKRLSRV